MDREAKLLEVYKISRNSVEHFDKILGVFRQIIFTFNGLLISSGIIFYINYFPKDVPKINVDTRNLLLIFFLGNLVLAAVNILVFLTEKHYHRYLEVSAKVAEEIEDELFGLDVKKHLTYQLGFFRKLSCNKILPCLRSYDLLYLSPVGGSIVLNFILFKKLHWCLGWGVASLLVYSGVCLYVILRNNKFSKSFTLVTEKNKQ